MDCGDKSSSASMADALTQLEVRIRRIERIFTNTKLRSSALESRLNCHLNRVSQENAVVDALETAWNLDPECACFLLASIKNFFHDLFEDLFGRFSESEPFSQKQEEQPSSSDILSYANRSIRKENDFDTINQFHSKENNDREAAESDQSHSTTRGLRVLRQIIRDVNVSDQMDDDFIMDPFMLQLKTKYGISPKDFVFIEHVGNVVGWTKRRDRSRFKDVDSLPLPVSLHYLMLKIAENVKCQGTVRVVKAMVEYNLGKFGLSLDEEA